jgi:hypothetical protein
MFVKQLINFEDSISTNDIFPNISSDSLLSFMGKKKLKSENFNNSENNVISVKLAQVLQYPLN